MKWEETKRVIDGLERVIAKTPTGGDRNALSEANILLQALLMGVFAEDVVINKKSNTMEDQKNYEKAWEGKDLENDKPTQKTKPSLAYANKVFEEIMAEFNPEERLEIMVYLKRKFIMEYQRKLDELDKYRQDNQKNLAEFLHTLNVQP